MATLIFGNTSASHAYSDIIVSDTKSVLIMILWRLES